MRVGKKRKNRIQILCECVKRWRLQAHLLRFVTVLSVLFAVSMLSNNTVTAFAGIRSETDQFSYAGDEVQVTQRWYLQDNASERVILHAGRDFTTDVTISAGNAGFEGKVTLLLLNDGSNIAYSEQIRVESGQSETVTFSVPLLTLLEGVRLKVEDADGRQLWEKTQQITAVNYGNYYVIGTMAEHGELDYLKLFGNQLIDVADEWQNCPDNVFDGLDILVVDEATISAMTASAEKGDKASERQLSELQKWLKKGKLLLVEATSDGSTPVYLNLGLQSNALLENIMAMVSDYESNRTSVVAANEELALQYGEKARLSYVGESMLNSVMAAAQSIKAVAKELHPMAETAWWNEIGAESRRSIWQEKQEDVIAEQSYGKGKIITIAFPMEAEKRDVYEMFYYRLVYLIMNNLPTEMTERQTMEWYGYENDSHAYLADHISEAVRKPISIMPYVVVLFLYIVIVIPICVIVLRGLRKSKYLWGILPATALVVTGIVYLLGADTRISEPYCRWMQISTYESGAEKGTQETYASVYLPTNRDETLRIPEILTFRPIDFRYAAYDIEWGISPYNSWERVKNTTEYAYEISHSEQGTELTVSGGIPFRATKLKTVNAVGMREMKTDTVQFAVRQSVMNQSVASQDMDADAIGTDGTREESDFEEDCTNESLSEVGFAEEGLSEDGYTDDIEDNGVQEYLVGTVTNTSGVDYYSAYLYCEGRIVKLGTLAAGESINLGERNQANAATVMFNYYEENGESLFEAEGPTEEDWLLINLFWNYYQNATEGTVIVGLQAKPEAECLGEAAKRPHSGGRNIDLYWNR